MRKTVFLLTILIVINQRWRNHWWLLAHGWTALISSRNKEAAEKPQYLTMCHRKAGYATDHASMAALVVTWPRAVPAPSHCRSTPPRHDATSRSGQAYVQATGTLHQGSRPQDTGRQFHERNADLSYCFSCGKGNHTTRNCRHQEPITCHQCKRVGHKVKYCDYYYWCVGHGGLMNSVFHAYMSYGSVSSPNEKDAFNVILEKENYNTIVLIMTSV